MTIDLDFSIKQTPFNADYQPAETTRLTTNFANLARGEKRKDNLTKALAMIDNRFNALADWDNPNAKRYGIELTILSVEAGLNASQERVRFPIIEMLKVAIKDHQSGETIDGLIGNSFSSYVRDYDFAIELSKYRDAQSNGTLPASFGELHGNLFKALLHSNAYKTQFKKRPVICLSVSSSKSYRRSDNCHPVLGVEYLQDEHSLTDDYFSKMGMRVRYFMPRGSVAPMAFYFIGDLLNDYSNLELIGTIATMETFQKIYRPEIYNANSPAGSIFSPSLNNPDFSLTQIVYDREERARLGVEQALFAEEQFLNPHRDALSRWCAEFSANCA